MLKPTSNRHHTSDGLSTQEHTLLTSSHLLTSYLPTGHTAWTKNKSSTGAQLTAPPPCPPATSSLAMDTTPPLANPNQCPSLDSLLSTLSAYDPLPSHLLTPLVFLPLVPPPVRRTQPPTGSSLMQAATRATMQVCVCVCVYLCVYVCMSVCLHEI